MHAELLLHLAGHPSSLFRASGELTPELAPLLHPGERDTLESLSRIARRYVRLKRCVKSLDGSSEYLSSLFSSLDGVLKDYEDTIVRVEAKILSRDDTVVASGSFVPISLVKAAFAEWDGPFAALESLFDCLEAGPRSTPSRPSTTAKGQTLPHWPPGQLIDMLLERSQTGVNRISRLISKLSSAVQRVWQIQLSSFLIHGTLSPTDPLADASSNHQLHEECIPACVSQQTRESIAYVGRAIATVRVAQWPKQMPRSTIARHAEKLSRVLPEDAYSFDAAISEIRTEVSEWLWTNVLTREAANDAVESLANYFLLRNGEFVTTLIREIERLKLSRLNPRVTSRSGMIREQDLALTLLRASVGTSAQHDPALNRLKFTLPAGPLRPLLRSLSSNANVSMTRGLQVGFDDLLLGTPLALSYTLSWPLDLFLVPSDLRAYSALFAYLSSIRRAQIIALECWKSLSNAQRARRRWTVLDEGGMEDGEWRRKLLRCGWGVVREMIWFFDTLWGYIMTDVVDIHFRKLNEYLDPRSVAQKSNAPPQSRNINDPELHDNDSHSPPPTARAPDAQPLPPLDFATLRSIHRTYLNNILSGTLLSHAPSAGHIREILEVCDRFVAQVERWGGDILPPLLFEGSLKDRGSAKDQVGKLVKERWEVVKDISETLNVHLEDFYTQLSNFQPSSGVPDTTLMNNTTAAHHTFSRLSGRLAREDALNGDGDTDSRRKAEHLLLRLDFNAGFSQKDASRNVSEQNILRKGGLA